MEEYKVSIIIPTHNSEKYIGDTLNSVLSQTYRNIEVLVVDDASTDNTISIIKNISNLDDRVKIIQLKVNSGAAVARNTGIKNATGRFIAFIDADDLWKKDKLEKQINFMLKNDIAFSFTDYELIDYKGESLKKRIRMPKKINYNGLLKNTIIQTCTVILDTKKISRIEMPNLRRGQDFATWLSILKEVQYAYALNESLAYYRRTPGSLSSNKFKAIRRTWYIYRNVENLSFPVSLCCFFAYVFHAIRKRIYLKKYLDKFLQH
ncbi:glycosyltransferase family 2 protein [Aeribacillus composti]|uniref:glycosyltransferase family 2 protein n=1 Tax=Aeribacillus composti TaxID=1868734 RepID=UPI00406A7C5D